jgi:hypothetical protein
MTSRSREIRPGTAVLECWGPLRKLISIFEESQEKGWVDIRSQLSSLFSARRSSAQYEPIGRLSGALDERQQRTHQLIPGPPNGQQASTVASAVLALRKREKNGRFGQNLHAATGTNFSVSNECNQCTSITCGSCVHRLLREVATCTLAALAANGCNGSAGCNAHTTCWSNDASRYMG